MLPFGSSDLPLEQSGNTPYNDLYRPPNLVLRQAGFTLPKYIAIFAVSSYLAFSTLPKPVWR